MMRSWPIANYWVCLWAVACFASVNCAASNASSRLFHQISADLAPYAAGIDRSMVDSMYCSSIGPSFRVQIKGQEVYIAGETRGFQSRNRNVKLALLEAARTFQDLPDADFILGSDDFSASESGVGGPIFAQAKRKEHTSAVLYPDHTFTDWQEADTAGWQHQQYIMLRAAVHSPWNDKAPSLIFRGSSMTGNRKIAAGIEATDIVDVQVWDWVEEPDRQRFMGLPDHCKSKYLLNWPGNTYSARLKYLLLCGSVVVHSDNGWFEFYYPLLTHGQHIMKTRSLAEPRDVTHNLKALVQHLRTNPKRSQKIAQAGQRFANDVLSPDNIKEYWYKLLQAYSALQKFTVELIPDAIPLGDSLSHPRYVKAEHRFGCHH